MSIQSMRIIRALVAPSHKDDAVCNATYLATLTASRELAHGAREYGSHTRRAQSAFSAGLHHVYQGKVATFAAVARVLERAYAEVEHTLTNGVHADVSSDA